MALERTGRLEYRVEYMDEQAGIYLKGSHIEMDVDATAGTVDSVNVNLNVMQENMGTFAQLAIVVLKNAVTALEAHVPPQAPQSPTREREPASG